MFFAPTHIQKRTSDWGPGIFEERAYRFWYEASRISRDWLRIDYHDGMDALGGIFTELLEGRVPPDKGVIVRL
jgi:hypothetical protein